MKRRKPVNGNTNTKPLAITDKTFIPIGIAIVVVGAVAGGAWWLSAMYSRLESIEKTAATSSQRLESTNQRLESIESAIKNGPSGAISERDIHSWLMLLQAQNPSMKIPEWPR